MTRSEAIDSLNASLAKDSATPSFDHEDRVLYLERMRVDLRACVIEPVQVTARAGAWPQQHLGAGSDSYQMVAVAYSPGNVGQCLLYDPSTRLFSLAYGHPGDDGDLELLGYSSDDALAIWLG